MHAGVFEKVHELYILDHRVLIMAIRKEVLFVVALTVVWGMALCCYGVSTGEKAGSATWDKAKLDILFVIDNSGSMKKNDPEFITREVVTNFSNGLVNRSRLGMVIFDQDARLVQPLTERTGPDANAALIKNLDEVNYKGQFTNSPAGIERAIYELKMNGRDDAEKVIIFLTDGIVDTGNKRRDIEKERWLREELARESKKAEIRIIGIAFTEKADVHLIQTLALKTDGAYFRAFRAADIPGIFVKINGLIGQEKDTLPTESPPTVVETVKQPATDLDSTPAEGHRSPPSEEYEASRWKDSIPLLIVIVALILVGTTIMIWFFRARTKDRLESGADQPQLREPSLPWGSMPEARLIDANNVSSKEAFPLIPNKSRITIGRDSGNDIVIPEETVSGFHATIEYKDGYFYLEDHRSTNGTYLNKRKIDQNKPVSLKSGDKVFFAAHEFKFLMLDQVPVGETVMLQSSSLPMGVDYVNHKESKKAVDDFSIFKDCLNAHLMRIRALGSTYESFVSQHIDDNMVDILAGKAEEVMRHTQMDLDEHTTTLARSPIFYQLCSLPVEIEHARAWFAQKHGGYVRLLSQSLNSEAFKTPGCTTLCLITYGRTQEAWISMTIVSSESDSDLIEIMSVEFLSEEERRTLAVDFGELGRAT